MGRYAYTLTMGFVVAAGAMLWIEHRGTSQLLAWLEPRTALAQSHEPADPPPPWRTGEAQASAGTTAGSSTGGGQGPLARAAVTARFVETPKAVEPVAGSPAGTAAPTAPNASPAASTAAVPTAAAPPWAALPPGIRTTGRIEPVTATPVTPASTPKFEDAPAVAPRGPEMVAARELERRSDLPAAAAATTGEPVIAARPHTPAEAPGPPGLPDLNAAHGTWQGYPLGAVLEIEGTPVRDGAFEVTMVNGRRIPMTRLRAKLEPTTKTREEIGPDGRTMMVPVTMERAIPVAPLVRMQGRIVDQKGAGLLFVATTAEDVRAVPTTAAAPQTKAPAPSVPAQPTIDPATGYAVTPFPAAQPENPTPKAYQLPPSRPTEPAGAAPAAVAQPAEVKPAPWTVATPANTPGTALPPDPAPESKPAASPTATAVAEPAGEREHFLPWRRVAAKPVQTPAAVEPPGEVSVGPEKPATPYGGTVVPQDLAHSLPPREPLRSDYDTTATPDGPQIAAAPMGPPPSRDPGFGAPGYTRSPSPTGTVPAAPAASAAPPVDIYPPPSYAQTPAPASPVAPGAAPATPAPGYEPPSYASRVPEAALPTREPAVPAETSPPAVAEADVAPWRRGAPDATPVASAPGEGAGEVRSAYADARRGSPGDDVRPASFSGEPGKRELQTADLGQRETPAVAEPRSVAGPEPTPKRPTPPASGQDDITDTTILALVNSEAILAAEVLPMVEARLSQILAQVPPEQMEAAAPEIGRAKKMLLQSHLEPLIQRKLLYQDARRDIPKPNFKGVEEQLVKDFDNRIDQMVAKKGYANRRQLDEEMTKQGNSLAMQRKSFIEEMLAREWLKRNSEISEDVRREELLSYYRKHQSDYEVKARARWEQLMIRFDKAGSKEQARFAIGKLGNRILDREDFAAVAKSGSHGPTAAEGGKRPWTTQGALVSKAIDEALFQLPVGQLSPILEDEQGLHIVRVIERQDAGRKPFEDVQGDIREKIKAERREKAQEKYAAKLQADAHIWRLLGEPDKGPSEKKPRS